MAVHDLIKEYMTAHQRILFNGDGYSKEWEKEAQRRGLPVFPGMIDSVEALTTDKAIRLYERFGIYNRAELESRKEIVYETYVKTIHIEAKTMIDMASKDILRYTVYKDIGGYHRFPGSSRCRQQCFKNAVERYLCSAVSGFRCAGKPETKGGRRKRAEERCEKAGIFLSGRDRSCNGSTARTGRCARDEGRPFVLADARICGFAV